MGRKRNRRFWRKSNKIDKKTESQKEKVKTEEEFWFSSIGSFQTYSSNSGSHDYLQSHLFEPATNISKTYQTLPLIYLKNDNIKSCEADYFEILQKLVSIIKYDTKSNMCIQILQNIIDEDLKQRNILDLILEVLNIFEDDCPGRLSFLEEHLLDFLLPKGLLAISTNKENVKGHSIIAVGGFGYVVKGQLIQENNTAVNVVIKYSKSLDKDRFLKNEACVMANLNHNNIVKILAFVQQPMMIIMEYFHKGDLKQYLRENMVPQSTLYKMIIDILTGMEYLSEKLYIHRDLATRNIFVSSQLECKIGDFGLTCKINEPKGIYVETSGRLDMFNSAPESRILQEFSIKSDVWAFGTTIWEMMYLKDCFMGFYGDPIQLIYQMFAFTFTLPSTQSCPYKLTVYINKRILHMNPDERPTFTDIKKFISSNYIDRGARC